MREHEQLERLRLLVGQGLAPPRELLRWALERLEHTLHRPADRYRLAVHELRRAAVLLLPEGSRTARARALARLLAEIDEASALYPQTEPVPGTARWRAWRARQLHPRIARGWRQLERLLPPAFDGKAGRE